MVNKEERLQKREERGKRKKFRHLIHGREVKKRPCRDNAKDGDNRNRRE
jgi:hypothetical protein